MASMQAPITVADEMLCEAAQMNPGPWVMHSQYVGLAARNIAQSCPHLDGNKAYAFGILHDIGRRYGITNMRHVIDGYRFCLEKGFSDAAKICLTHSFPYKDIKEAFGKWDCTDTELLRTISVTPPMMNMIC
jgi:HD superfamily phosphohydrolase YqeK